MKQHNFLSFFAIMLLATFLTQCASQETLDWAEIGTDTQADQIDSIAPNIDTATLPVGSTATAVTMSAPISQTAASAANQAVPNNPESAGIVFNVGDQVTPLINSDEAELETPDGATAQTMDAGLVGGAANVTLETQDDGGVIAYHDTPQDLFADKQDDGHWEVYPLEFISDGNFHSTEDVYEAYPTESHSIEASTTYEETMTAIPIVVNTNHTTTYEETQSTPFTIHIKTKDFLNLDKEDEDQIATAIRPYLDRALLNQFNDDDESDDEES